MARSAYWSPRSSTISAPKRKETPTSDTTQSLAVFSSGKHNLTARRASKKPCQRLCHTSCHSCEYELLQPSVMLQSLGQVTKTAGGDGNTVALGHRSSCCQVQLLQATVSHQSNRQPSTPDITCDGRLAQDERDSDSETDRLKEGSYINDYQCAALQRNSQDPNHYSSTYQ